MHYYIYSNSYKNIIAYQAINSSIYCCIAISTDPEPPSLHFHPRKRCKRPSPCRGRPPFPRKGLSGFNCPRQR